MKKISDFLDGASWEVRELEEIVELGKPDGEDENRRILRPGDLNNLESIYFSDWKSQEEAEKPTSIPGSFVKNNILVLISDWNRKNIGKSFLYIGEEKHHYSSGVTALKSKINPKYLIHVLNSGYFMDQVGVYLDKKHIKGIAIGIRKSDLKKIKIPIADQRTQDLIVRYLDEFYLDHKDLERELMAELEDRKIQYEEFKSNIFYFEEWEIKRISEISEKINRGSQILEKLHNTGHYPLLTRRDLKENLPRFFHECKTFIDPELIKSKRYCEYGNLVVSDSGESITYLGTEKCLVSNPLIIVKHNLNPKYLQYLWNSGKFMDQINKKFSYFGKISLNKEDIESIEIPVPSKDLQMKIVKILDHYQSLMEDLEKTIDGLIKDNRKQYEVHKNLMFSLN